MWFQGTIHKKEELAIKEKSLQLFPSLASHRNVDTKDENRRSYVLLMLNNNCDWAQIIVIKLSMDDWSLT